MYFHTFGKKYFKWADKILKCIKPIIYTQYHPESAYHSILYRLIYINRTNISSICIEKKQTSQLIWGGGKAKVVYKHIFGDFRSKKFPADNHHPPPAQRFIVL